MCVCVCVFVYDLFLLLFMTAAPRMMPGFLPVPLVVAKLAVELGNEAINSCQIRGAILYLMILLVFLTRTTLVATAAPPAKKRWMRRAMFVFVP